MHSRWNTTWCVFGDFNTIQYPSERFGCEAFSSAMFAFSDFFEANYLVDLPLEGALFTWFRESGSDCMSRIDRTLALVDWVDRFGNVSQRVHPRVVSDHCPLLAMAGSVNKGRSAFKFENMWLKEEGFVERVRQWWNGYCFSGSSSFILGHKLKALKEDLKKWNKEDFGDLAFRKKCFLSELLGLDAREDLSGLSYEDLTRRSQIKGEIAHLASLEEISWRQKSRILFVKEGDNNTRFFHQVANFHRRTKHIQGIDVDGVLYEDEEEVRSIVVQFYPSLYTESNTWRPSMDGLEFARIDEAEQLALKRDFSKKEVVRVLQEMEGDKAPGPNNFIMAFFQKC